MKTKKFVKKIVKEFENEKLIVYVSKEENLYSIIVSNISSSMFDIIAKYKGKRKVIITHNKLGIEIIIYRSKKWKD